MLIMVAGPYRSGGADAAQRAANLRILNEAALSVFRRGHIPLIGVNAALPIIEIAGEESYDAIMMPVSLALADRCDACLRVGGPSLGADEEVERFRARGLPVFFRVEDLPP
ncbi:hypothetical protein [Azospirillum agricola]|uniref:hypothetical protein n=1 Tax=Azospirillum agricola TaxID=1720247 RepID=UPI000A0F3786|nr:hypothetical protein [Azospirillum agricola]SMH36103.1 hypothetical protein SAMN02982994_0980 [Azospirillum lipoferum]